MNNLSLVSSCKSGNLEAVVQCLQDGADVNCYEGWPLRRAVRHNRSEVWRHLLANCEVNINLANQHGLSSLHTAARFGVVSAVQSLLLMPNIHPNMKTQTGATPLFVAVKYARLEVVEVLVNDPRVDLCCQDFQNRSPSQVVGVSVTDCDELIKNNICDLIRQEENRRRIKQKKIEAARPEQILVRQAKEKLDKFINDLEEKQKSELLMFQENLDNDRREFHVKQEEEKYNFFSKMQSEEKEFHCDQERQKTIFLSRIARKKYLFERMQEDLREEYLAFKKQTFEDFKEKQLEEKETLLVSQNSPRQSRARPNRWSFFSLEVARLLSEHGEAGEDLLTRGLGGAGPAVSLSDKERSTCNSRGLTALQSGSARKLSCPPTLSDVLPSPPPLPPLTRQWSSSSNTSGNPSPVPSLELISDLISSIPPTCPNIKALLALNILSGEEQPGEEEPDSTPSSPLLHASYLTYPFKTSSHSQQVSPLSTKSTPRITRKNTMEVVKEESDEDASVINYNIITGMVNVSSFNSNSSSSLESDFKLRRRSSSDSDIGRTREGCWFS